MYYSGNFFLTREQMEVNALYIYNILITKGWTVNSISGMLGNMQTESTINPSIWQNLDSGNLNLGFGLVQWTPASKYIDWCNANGIDYLLMESNLDRIEWEVTNNVQWIATTDYNYSFQEFKESTDNPYKLGIAFLRNYERPANPNQEQRGIQAMEWYTFLTGIVPPFPPTKRKSMPLLFYMKQS